MKHNYSVIASTLALVVALTGTGALAAGLVGSKEIKNHSIKAKDLHRGAVITKTIKAGAVTPQSVNMPAPKQFAPAARASASADDPFQLAETAGTYDKLAPDSVLQVSWSGVLQAGFSPCIFELRVDGQPSANSGGDIYVLNSNTQSVSVTSLFPGLPPGQHTVQIYKRSASPGYEDQCVVSPADPGIPATVTAQEIVL